METVLIFTQKIDPRLLIPALGDREVKLAGSRRELVESILREKNPLCVLLEPNPACAELQDFLASLKKSFPLLRIALLAPPHALPLPEGFPQIDPTAPEELLNKEIDGFLASMTPSERREHHRFDWPLGGNLSLDRETWQKFRIRSLSASGAFLESSTFIPKPGTIGLLRIFFQDFKMLTSCELLDPRRASSNLPAGFGVRFTDLSETSRRLIDRIVEDALVLTLLEADAEPQPPSIGEGEPLTASFELL